MSRAGLVSLILFSLYITLAASAPLPGLREERELSFLTERDFDIADGNYYTREVTAHGDLLYPRSVKSPHKKTKARPQKAGKATKQVVQTGSALQKYYFSPESTSPDIVVAKMQGN